MTYHGASRGDDVSLFNGHLGIINRIKHLRLLRVSLSNQVPLSPVPDPPAANNLAQTVGVSAECERMQFALILNFAGALEEGRHVPQDPRATLLRGSRGPARSTPQGDRLPPREARGAADAGREAGGLRPH